MSLSTDNHPPGAQLNVETPQRGPVSRFDYHLNILSDSYLAFFQERKRVEEAYVDSLVRLHRKTQAIDAFFDDRADLSSTRSAWREVRDNLEREAQTRTAFLTTLNVDVLNPLVSLRETQDRTRKRIREDLKTTGVALHEFVENILPKYKRSYLKKCQEAEDQKTGPQIASQGALSPTDQQNSSKTAATAPYPLRPAERRPPPSGAPARPRSPPGAGPFSDFASQGKKQLNSLITFLDKSGKESSAARSENTLRAVRLKREADDADKEYRKAIHHCETLRLRRAKTLENGYKSLEMFIQEASTMVKKVLEKYADNMIATTTTQTQLAGHARSVLSKISPESDASAIASKNARALAVEVPRPILYQNYHVGECKDLIFGVSLVDYATARGLSDGEVPKILRLSIKEIDQRGLTSEGIYRVSGRYAVVQELQLQIEWDEALFKFNSATDDVTAVSSLLKLYLRELPEPVFRFPLQERIQHTEELAEHTANNFKLLRSKIRRLPAVHQATLKLLVEHLARVTANSEKNKMGPKNIAISFGGVIFGEEEIPKGQNLLNLQAWNDTLMEDLIKNASILFDERGASDSPPLPPAPEGEPVPPIAYGSSHTKFASLPPPDSSRQQSDFSPALPPRPTSSIHPSLRANPAVQAREQSEPPAVPSKGGTAENASISAEHTKESVLETDSTTPTGTDATSLHAHTPIPSPPATPVENPVAEPL